MAAAAFTFAALALAGAAFLGATTLRLRGASLAIGTYVLGWAAVVGLGELLSLVDAVGRTGYLAGSVCLAGLAAVVWHVRGRPLPPRPQLRARALREHPQLAVLAAVVAGAVAYEAFLVIATPPNNYDSLTYHLTRVAAWLQQGHVGYFDAATARANAFPGNAELGILYTVALLGRDTVAALPQLLAELGVLACVFGIGRRLGFGRPASTFAALLTATLAQVALQSTTTQNDLVVASFVAAAAYFVLAREIPLAGLAVALAVGTKLTGLLALPLLVVLAIAVLPRRRIAQLAACAAVAFVGFGAYWYAENTVRTHHPLGVVPEADAYRADRSAGGTVSTAARVSWRFVDFSGLQPPEGLLTGLSNFGASLFRTAHVDPNPQGATATGFGFQPGTQASEDASYFGVLGFLLLLPLSGAFVVAWLCRRTGRARGAVAAAIPLFLLAVALTQSYNDWLGRFMLIPVVIVMPLAAWLYERRFRLLTLLAAGLGVLTLAGAHKHNIAKPAEALGASRATLQTVATGPFRCALPLVDASVPDDARLGVVLGSNDPAYLLYGRDLRRRLVELHPGGAVRAAEAQGLLWIVVGPDEDAVAGAPGWRTQEVRGGWRLLTRLDGLAGAPVSVGVDCRPSTRQTSRVVAAAVPAAPAAFAHPRSGG